MTHLKEHISETVAFLREKGVQQPTVGLILGSGLGELAQECDDALVIPYADIPHFPTSHVVGHSSELVYGTLSGKSVLIMKGRFHYYEGHSLSTVTFPLRVMKALGVQTVLLTNAAGGVNHAFQPGDLMLLTDHINFTGQNPLIGPNDDQLGPRFTDLSDVYYREGRKMVHQVAQELGLTLHEGVYMWFTGPVYETPAEIKMARTMGADAVGMSTVPEALVATHAGMKVLGISCITNLAAGMQATLDHEEVVAVTQRVKQQFKQLMKQVVARL